MYVHSSLSPCGAHTETSLLVAPFTLLSAPPCAAPLSLCCLLGRGALSDGATVGVVAGEGPVVGEREGLNPPNRSNRLRLSCTGTQAHCETL